MPGFYDFKVISMTIFLNFISMDFISIFFHMKFISMSFISKFDFLIFISMSLSVWPVFQILSVFGYQYTDKKYPKMAILIKKNLWVLIHDLSTVAAFLLFDWL